MICSIIRYLGTESSTVMFGEMFGEDLILLPRRTHTVAPGFNRAARSNGGCCAAHGRAVRCCDQGEFVQLSRFSYSALLWRSFDLAKIASGKPATLATPAASATHRRWR
jgi:hypothetical protein